MTSSSRADQLSLWREIVPKRHEGPQQVNRHLDYIQRRFDALDSAGFVWSKESIVDIFLQLGLPESSHGAFSSVNEILDSRVLLGCKTSAHDVKELIQTEELRHESHPLGLMDLPIEVFNKILGTLDVMARLEAKEIALEKEESLMTISESGDRRPYMTYLHRHPPILNSLRTFSLTCREIY